MRLEEIDLATWEAELPASGYEVFHDPRALAVLGEHADSELLLYGVYKGQEAVCLVPVFREENPLGRAHLSPPPSMGVPRLGPLVMPNSPKQRKREAVNREFVDLLLDELDATAQRSLLRMECPLGYDDPRPFAWAGLEVTPRFTYVLDLESTTPEEVRGAFSRDLRKEISRIDELPVSVAVEGVDAAARVQRQVADRYAEQGEEFPVTEAFFRDLVDALDDRCRVYVARDPDGEFLSGIVVLYSGDLASFWQGGVRSDYDGVSVNTAIHWAVVSDVLEDSDVDARGYDLVGANTPRLCRYKSKFGADPVAYYAVESTGLGMAVAKRAYRMVGK